VLDKNIHYTLISLLNTTGMTSLMTKQRLLICGQIMSCECCESFRAAVLGAVGVYRRQDEGTNSSDKLK